VILIIKMDLTEAVCEDLDWVHVEGSCVCSNEPLGSIKGRKYASQKKVFVAFHFPFFVQNTSL
jgi:hypothetical protein